jgi:hypothetical protein
LQGDVQESFADEMKARGAGGEAAPRPWKKKKIGALCAHRIVPSQADTALVSDMIRDEHARRFLFLAARRKRRKGKSYPQVPHAKMKVTEAYLKGLLERTGVPEFPPEAFCAVAEARRAAALDSINEHLGGSVY